MHGQCIFLLSRVQNGVLAFARNRRAVQSAGWRCGLRRRQLNARMSNGWHDHETEQSKEGKMNEKRKKEGERVRQKE